MKVKTILLLLAGVILWGIPASHTEAATIHADGSVAIDEENFSDENFREYVKRDFDLNRDNILSREERMAVKEMKFGIDDRIYRLSSYLV